MLNQVVYYEFALIENCMRSFREKFDQVYHLHITK